MIERTVADIAAQLGIEFEGDGDAVITGVAGLREAVPGDVSFLAQTGYAHLVEATRASAVVVDGSYAESFDGVLFRAADVNVAFQQIVALFSHVPVERPEGIHPTAVVAPDATLGDGVRIGACAVVESGAVVGADTCIWPGAFIGHGVRMGTECIIYPQVTLREFCELGDRVILHPGVVIGSDGFGYEADQAGKRTKVGQLGIVSIGNDVEIGCNSAVDRARFGRTRIGNGAKIDNLVHVAHNVVVGDDVVLIAQVGIAGSTTVGDKVIMGGQAGAAGHLSIGEGAIITARCGVIKDVGPGERMGGFPAIPQAKFARGQVNLQRIPQLKDRIAALEQRLSDLESGS